MMLKKKLEEAMENNKSLVVSMSNDFMECINTIRIDNFELSEDHLALCQDNYELHIKLKEVAYEENGCDEEDIILSCDNTSVRIYFLN